MITPSFILRVLTIAELMWLYFIKVITLLLKRKKPIA